FIDADKERYSQYFEICLDLLNSGGFLLADNVLWSGKVLHENPDKTTASIIEFNRMVYQNTRVENFILPIRDGINIIRKLQ
ncbi:MAG TPA: methyltransferase, partial [Saprospiraceae bacterium]|nr:methyltransferase [Saprospiraceae bacterium]